MWYGSECWSCKCIECFSPNMFSPHEIGSVKDLSCWCSSIQDILRTRMVFSAIFWMACMFVCYTRVKKNEYMVKKCLMISYFMHRLSYKSQNGTNLFVVCTRETSISFSIFRFFFFILNFNIFSPHRKIPSTLWFL